MAEPITDERLAEIREREQAAPKGPWRIERHEPSLCNYILSEGGELEIGLGYVGNRTEAEGNFIVHARTDVPDLLAEVESLRAQAVDRARVRDLLASLRAAMERGDIDTVAMNIGQIGHHVSEEADRG